VRVLPPSQSCGGRGPNHTNQMVTHSHNFYRSRHQNSIFPHTDVMVITTHIDKWDVTRVLVDNGSQTEILFLSVFNQMGFDRRQLKEASKPLYGFGGKRIEPVGSMSLPVSSQCLHIIYHFRCGGHELSL
jgi:hypothetical protein